MEEVFFNYFTIHSELVVVNDQCVFTFDVTCVLPLNNEVGMKLYCCMYHPGWHI